VDGILSTQPIRDGEEWEGMLKAQKSLVAATFEKANTYVFAAPIIRDREVGGSNPLAPTNQFNHLRLPAKVAVLVLWQDIRESLSCSILMQAIIERFNNQHGLNFIQTQLSG
jgi:hypothetical protein